MTEKEVFQQLKMGQPSALEYLYHQHRAKCLGYARKRLFRKLPDGRHKFCSAEEALGLYHEAIIIFVENIREERLTELYVKISTYLISIMKNKWLQMIRREDTQVDDFPNLAMEGEALDHEIREKVRSGLVQIDPKCRQMLSLRYFLGWDYDDIASSMGYNKGDVVRNLISRCRSKFREILQQSSKSSPR